LLSDALNCNSASTRCRLTTNCRRPRHVPICYSCNTRSGAEHALASFDAAVTTWRTLGSAEDDERWRDQLTTWRSALCAELLTIKSPIRDKAVMGRSINLTLSIKVIDFGLHKTVEDSGYDLSTLALGQLMREAGYEPQGADPDRSYTGVMPWQGSLPEVTKRIAVFAEQRQRAEATLASVLLSDDERAAQEAESTQLRDAFNAMTVKMGDDRHLYAIKDGAVLDVSKMTELQRKAIARMDDLQRRAS
jgi:hypothetical protein